MTHKILHIEKNGTIERKIERGIKTPLSTFNQKKKRLHYPQ